MVHVIFQMNNKSKSSNIVILVVVVICLIMFKAQIGSFIFSVLPIGSEIGELVFTQEVSQNVTISKIGNYEIISKQIILSQDPVCLTEPDPSFNPTIARVDVDGCQHWEIDGEYRNYNVRTSNSYCSTIGSAPECYIIQDGATVAIDDGCNVLAGRCCDTHKCVLVPAETQCFAISGNDVDCWDKFFGSTSREDYGGLSYDDINKVSCGDFEILKEGQPIKSINYTPLKVSFNDDNLYFELNYDECINKLFYLFSEEDINLNVFRISNDQIEFEIQNNYEEFVGVFELFNYSDQQIFKKGINKIIVNTVKNESIIPKLYILKPGSMTENIKGYCYPYTGDNVLLETCDYFKIADLEFANFSLNTSQLPEIGIVSPNDKSPSTGGGGSGGGTTSASNPDLSSDKEINNEETNSKIIFSDYLLIGFIIFLIISYALYKKGRLNPILKQIKKW